MPPGGGAPERFIGTGVSWEPAALQKCRELSVLRSKRPWPWQGPAAGGPVRFLLPVVLRAASGQRSGGGRAVHGGQEVSDLGPLGRADVLAHVHHAVHSHLGVVLDQAAGGGREGLGP